MSSSLSSSSFSAAVPAAETASSNSSDSPPSEEDKRFLIELEFVQSLSNLSYLEHLAQNGYMKDAAFVNYLKYLLYWKKPEYAKFIVYPYCLYMLEMLQDDNVRRALAHHEAIMDFHGQQFYTWRHHYSTLNQLLSPVDALSETSAASSALTATGPGGDSTALAASSSSR